MNESTLLIVYESGIIQWKDQSNHTNTWDSGIPFKIRNSIFTNIYEVGDVLVVQDDFNNFYQYRFASASGKWEKYFLL